MLLDQDFWKVMIGLIVAASVMIGPSVYYIRFNTNKNDERNKSLLADMQARNEKGLERLEKGQADFNSSMKADLKEFRLHLDSRFTEVYSTVDIKIKELREQLSKDLDYSKKHISNLESRVESQQEKTHNIEKDILRLENVLGKDYITREQLEMILKLKERGH